MLVSAPNPKLIIVHFFFFSFYKFNCLVYRNDMPTIYPLGKSGLYNVSCLSDGTMHWEKLASTPPPVGDGWVFRPYHQAASANVEMTAYVLMSIIMNAQKSDAIPTALPIVRWLTQQRNAQGGFSSTQVKHLSYLQIECSICA